MALFRYPGSKGKASRRITNIIIDLYKKENLWDYWYTEPFFGAGGIGFKLLSLYPQINKVWINDYDAGVASVWNCIIKHPVDLCNAVDQFEPSVKNFFQIKKTLLKLRRNKPSTVKLAFQKIAIHQMSYSGLGVMSGGPLGGVAQDSEYDIACRWNAEGIKADIKKLHKLLISRKIKKNKCWSKDFESVIDNKSLQFLYCDPPYYVKGPELYQYGFSTADHLRLSEVLKSCKNPWLLSYDDCEEIRKLYSWASISEMEINYTINTSQIYGSKKELLIISPQYESFLKQEDLLKEIDMYE
jgi:DNA adenine methylase